MGCTRYGRILRQIRARRREVMQDMAKVLGVAPSFLSAVENGKERIPEDWAHKIANHYVLSDEELKKLEQANVNDDKNKLGKYVYNERVKAGLTRNALALKAGISHTEIKRIEEGQRKSPSCSHLKAIANALMVPIYEIYQVAGIMTEDMSLVDKAFPSLTTAKQRDTLIKIARLIATNADRLTDNDLDELAMQVDMFLLYVTDRKKEVNHKFLKAD